jgi:ABC-type nickel/cobalt efflux system permease component RcnA
MLFASAVMIGFLHTVVGPDHYLPFILIGRARGWGLGRTSLLTFACGLGHVLSSIAIGMIGIAASRALQEVQAWESMRGQWAAWGLMLFGGGYLAFGLWRGLRPAPTHSHAHLHPRSDHDAHAHLHAHPHDHAHAPEASEGRRSWKELTPWLLFIIFVLGPCEPLIPLFFASALKGEWLEVALVATGYGLATLAAMHLIVIACWLGLERLRWGRIERWSHALAGGVVLLSGAGIVFLGL